MEYVDELNDHPDVHYDYRALLVRYALEEMKTMPFQAVWDYFCLVNDVPAGGTWLSEVQRYEREVLSRRQ